MSFPKKFGDFGKAAADFFKNDFGASTNKLTFQTKAADGSNVKFEGSQVNATGNVSGFVETKTKFQGFEFKEKWSTSNQIDSEVAHDCILLPHARHTLVSSFNPTKGGFSGFSNLKLKSALPCDFANTNLTISSKDVVADTAFEVKGVNVGGTATIATSNFALNSYKVGVAFPLSDIDVAVSMTNGDVMETTMFQKSTSSKLNLSSAVKFGWTKSTGKTFLEVGVERGLEKGSTLKLKLNDKLDMGVSYKTAFDGKYNLVVKADVAASTKLGFELSF